MATEERGLVLIPDPHQTPATAPEHSLTTSVVHPAARLPDELPDVIAQLWADARSSFFAGGFPKYASPEWAALHPDDPRRLAAALAAAEMWRKYGDEEALLAWFREASRARPSIADRRTRAELDQAARRKPPHQLRATPGWPPVAIPGQPGKYLTYRAQKAA